MRGNTCLKVTMANLEGELRNWIEAAGRRSVAGARPAAKVEHVGIVEHVGDGIASIAGLPLTRFGELLRFEDGTRGLALSVEQSRTDCVILGSGQDIAAGTRVFNTGEVATIPVGPGLLGRTLDAIGKVLDGGPPVTADRFDPVERPAPGILERDVISEPLITGVTVVDSMIPLGRGQRSLLLGDRKTGKTALAVDTVVQQRTSDVICVYAFIGQKTSTIEQVIDAIRQHGAIERCIFIAASASATPGMQWLVPYAACTIAEYFRDRGQHALLVLDDLSKHAIAYRQISLLLRRPPGREAYPGDIFYIHSRLLERAAKLSEKNGGGSLTALPIVETESGNLSAYIPTNLISITDGQIYFDPKLFYEGQKPAVNVGLSVSRVGAKTQAPAFKDSAASLRLEYAQFVELEVFTRFGAMVDERTRKRIEHGRRIRAILSQPRFATRSLAEQTALLLALEERVMDDLDLDAVARFRAGLDKWLTESCPDLYAALDRTGTLSADDRRDLLAVLKKLAAETTTGQPEPS
jgi:F-type H+-transporting ATPase subunit alpha